jgi:hypothetical protein
MRPMDILEGTRAQNVIGIYMFAMEPEKAILSPFLFVNI